jgi:hypothetical protein
MKKASKSVAKTKAPKADPDLIPLATLDKQKKTPRTKGKGDNTTGVQAAKPPAAPKAAKETKLKALSCLDAAVVVLTAKGEPMACKQMIEAMAEQGLWKSDAPTPAATLYSAVLREITRKGSASRFKKTDRGLFGLSA